MTNAQLLSLFIAVVGGLYLWRSFAAINATYKNKMNILAAIKKTADPLDRMELLKDEMSVSYNQHYRCVFWLKDPWPLYPETILKLMGRHEA